LKPHEGAGFGRFGYRGRLPEPGGHGLGSHPGWGRLTGQGRRDGPDLVELPANRGVIRRAVSLQYSMENRRMVTTAEKQSNRHEGKIGILA
jgi:hypothetical protein